MSERIQRLNLFVITIVVLYTIIVQTFLNQIVIFNHIIDSILALFTSIGVYRLLLIGLYAIFSKSEYLLKLYWGRLYLAGLWSYTYKKRGEDKPYFGVWRFEQDLFKTTLVGFGLDENFEERSTVRSVTDLIENRGLYEIVNLRRDSIDPTSEYYSTTTMNFDRNEGGFFARHPIKIRAQTIIYGGTLTGDIHKDVFIKHENAKSEDDVILELKKKLDSKIS